MKQQLTPTAVKAYVEARPLSRRPSTSKSNCWKYDDARDIWQARVSKNWRFYFSVPHPK
jgi:hypothetical protein